MVSVRVMRDRLAVPETLYCVDAVDNTQDKFSGLESQVMDFSTPQTIRLFLHPCQIVAHA